MKKNNVFKRISCAFLALCFAFTILFIPNINSANAETVIVQDNNSVNINFEPFSVNSSVHIPSLIGLSGASGILPINYNLSIYCEPNHNTDTGADNSRFTFTLYGNYGYWNDNYSTFSYENKLFLSTALSYNFDVIDYDNFLNYEETNRYNFDYGFYDSVTGFSPSNSWYELDFYYSPNIGQLKDVSTPKNITDSVANQFGVPFIAYIYSTNSNSTGFDWSKINKLKHTVTEPYGQSYIFGSFAGESVYFNCFDIYDFIYTEDNFFRLAFPSFNYNLPFYQETLYFENLGYSVGYDQGYDLGYREGLTTNSSESYKKGYADGYQVGENIGYENGVNKQENQFTNLITAVIDVPIKTFLSLFDINIFGYDLKAFVISLFSIALIIAIVRFVT